MNKENKIQKLKVAISIILNDTGAYKKIGELLEKNVHHFGTSALTQTNFETNKEDVLETFAYDLEDSVQFLLEEYIYSK